MRQRSNAVISQNHKILICEVVITDSGEYALRVKKPGASVYEVIPIGEFLALFYKAARDVA